MTRMKNSHIQRTKDCVPTRIWCLYKVLLGRGVHLGEIAVCSMKRADVSFTDSQGICKMKTSMLLQQGVNIPLLLCIAMSRLNFSENP